MKKTICLLLIIICFSGYVSYGENSEATVLLDRLSAFMDTQEQIFDCQEAVFQAVDDFIEHADYTSLVHARLECDNALRRLAAIRLPDVSLDDAEILALMKQKVEVIALEDAGSELNLRLESAVLQVYFWKNYLYAAIQFTNTFSDGLDWLTALRQELFLRETYTCLWVNDLLLPLENNADVIALWNEFETRWPTTDKARQHWINDANTLMSEGYRVMEELESFQDETSRFMGIGAYHTEQNASATGSADVNEDAVYGMPDKLPLPAFWKYVSLKTLRESSGGHTPGNLPSLLVWSLSPVTEEQFMQYAQQLENCGMKPMGEMSGSSEAGWEGSLQIDGKVIILSWNPSNSLLIAYNPALLTLELM